MAPDSEKLQALQILVKELLAPWNAPVFVKKIKSVKFRFLTDVNQAYVSTRQQLYQSKQPVCILINFTLKAILAKPKRGRGRLTQSELDTAVSKNSHTTPARRHFVTIPRQPRKESNTQAGNKETWAMVKDMASGIGQGPYKILIWGPGYVCVSTGKGDVWIPIRRIRRWKLVSETTETQEATSLETPGEGPCTT